MKNHKEDFSVEKLEEAALAEAQAVISQAMKQAGLLQYELAHYLQVPPSAISRMLNGKQNLTLKTFTRALIVCGFQPTFTIQPIEVSRLTELER